MLGSSFSSSGSSENGLRSSEVQSDGNADEGREEGRLGACLGCVSREERVVAAEGGGERMEDETVGSKLGDGEPPDEGAEGTVIALAPGVVVVVVVVGLASSSP